MAEQITLIYIMEIKQLESQARYFEKLRA